MEGIGSARWVFGCASLNADLKNRLVNKWSCSKQASALHQKAPFICGQESLSLYSEETEKGTTDADERTVV